MAKRNGVEVVDRDETEVDAGYTEVVGVHTLGTAVERNDAAMEVEVEGTYAADIDAVLEE